MHRHAYRGDLGDDASSFTASDLIALAAPSTTPRLSIYLPTHRNPADGEQDRIRLRHLLTEARRGEPDISAQAESAEVLAATRSFWAHPTEGLALLADHAGVRRHWLPATVPEIAVAGRHRHLKPLLPLVAGDGRFFVLELHQRGVRLYAGTRSTLHEITLQPEAEAAEDPVRSNGDRRDVEGRSAGRGMIWFGGAHEEGAKERAERFFHRVSGAVEAAAPGGAPLVLAGIEWLQSAYRRASRHPRLLDAGIAVDTATMEIHDLHRRAWDIASPVYARRQAETEERHAVSRGGDRFSHLLSDVIALAAQGRVESVLVALDRERWGTYADDLSSVIEHPLRERGDEDLLNVAALAALRTGASAFAIPAALLPPDGVSAVLRY